jgi:aminoglycoside phosphotransferase (APT) family kinase protein
LEKGTIVGQGRDAEIIYWGNNQVLKHYREGIPKFLIDFEFKASELVKKYYTYAPKVFEKVMINEREGIIYEFIDGRNLTEILKKSPLKVSKLAKVLAKLHGAMHQLKFPVIREQKEYFEEKIRNVQLLSIDQKNFIINYLKNLSSDSILCHGDFHMENVLISTNGSKVIDWGNINVGNHHADVARTLYILKHSYDPASPNQSFLFNFASRLFRYYFVKKYIKCYKIHKNISLKQVKKWNLIVYAIRIGEGIIEEQNYLIKQIREGIKRLKLK